MGLSIFWQNEERSDRKAIKCLIHVDEFISTTERSSVMAKTANDLWLTQWCAVHLSLALSDGIPEANFPRWPPGWYSSSEDTLMDTSPLVMLNCLQEETATWIVLAVWFRRSGYSKRFVRSRLKGMSLGHHCVAVDRATACNVCIPIAQCWFECSLHFWPPPC